MKIIHCADIHIGSRLESSLPKDKGETKKREVKNSFSRLVDYAKENEISVILLAGDVFDKDNPSIEDKKYFYRIIKNNPNIDFLYLNGNHDKEGSYVDYGIPNLKTFQKDEFVSYDYDDIVISGIEMTNENYKSFYSKINLDKSKKNIVMLHGEATDSFGINKIKIDSLKNKGIDYLALGHIHSYRTGKIDDRGVYAFSGCLEGRGFDECGEKGFILLDIDEKITPQYIPFASRNILEINIDVSDCDELYDIEVKIKKTVENIDKKNILSIILTGDISNEVNVDIKHLELSLRDFFFVRIKNKTGLKIDVSSFENDKSLRGEFIRGVYSNPNYSDEEKQKIVSIGLRVISGKEVE